MPRWARRSSSRKRPSACASRSCSPDSASPAALQPPRSRSRASRSDAVTLRVRVDRHKCIGAGNCITIAPTAFDWLRGDLGKAEVLDPDSVDDELLREATFACPTGAIVIEEVADLLPWQLRG